MPRKKKIDMICPAFWKGRGKYSKTFLAELDKILKKEGGEIHIYGNIEEYVEAKKKGR